MAEENKNIEQDHKAIAHLLEVVGGIVVYVGGQPMVNGIVTQSPYDIVRALCICLIGTVVLFIGLFWHRISPRPENRLYRSLASLASNAWSYYLFILVGVAYFAASNIISEVKLNNEIISLRNDELSIAKVIERGLMPRHLDDEQKKVMGDFLLQFPPHQYAFELPRGDTEAGAYRGDIEDALMKGGWTRADDPYKYKDPTDIQEGVNVTFWMSSSHTDTRANIRDPWPDRLVAIAFGLAQARIDDYGESGGANINQDRLVISIGKRRTDSQGFIPPKFRF